MANLPRPSKPPSDWNLRDLHSYHITVVDEDAKTFFGKTTLRPPKLSSLRGFLSTPQSQDTETAKLCHYFDLADLQTGAYESAVDNFSVKILEKLGYDVKKRIIFTQLPLQLRVCDHDRMTKINVSILANDGRVLLIQENKIHNNHHNPLPRVVAEAIAAFNENIKIFKTLRKPYHRSITIPAITMHGTSPTFYRITVTSNLAKAVRNGTYPAIQTTVHRHVPVLPIPTVRAGMSDSRNRQHIMTCLNAFKIFLED